MKRSMGWHPSCAMMILTVAFAACVWREGVRGGRVGECEQWARGVRDVIFMW
jgi:hypothetical protein